MKVTSFSTKLCHFAMQMSSTGATVIGFMFNKYTTTQSELYTRHQTDKLIISQEYKIAKVEFLYQFYFIQFTSVQKIKGRVKNPRYVLLAILMIYYNINSSRLIRNQQQSSLKNCSPLWFGSDLIFVFKKICILRYILVLKI